MKRILFCLIASCAIDRSGSVPSFDHVADEGKQLTINGGSSKWMPPSGGSGSVGARGATGPTGAQGPTGAAGSNGANGATGSVGATGPIGPTGAAGANGTNGANGATGAIGATGAPGATGPQGANGAAGSAGPTGAIGATGAPGATGPQGTAGSNGAVGATGPPGATGAVGATGAGVAGPTGAPGATGPQGAAGTNGTNGTNGATGPPGATGAIGATGAGVAGPTGAPGATGALGPTGAIGATGAGVAGPTGPPGATGSIGPTGGGTPGATGPTGAAGSNGSNGATGPTGPTGPQGTAGSAGAAGATGAKGATGATGSPFVGVNMNGGYTVTSCAGEVYYDTGMAGAAITLPTAAVGMRCSFVFGSANYTITTAGGKGILLDITNFAGGSIANGYSTSSITLAYIGVVNAHDSWVVSDFSGYWYDASTTTTQFATIPPFITDGSQEGYVLTMSGDTPVWMSPGVGSRGPTGATGAQGTAGPTGAPGPTGSGGAASYDATQFAYVDDFMSATTTFKENWFVSVSSDSLTSNSTTGMGAGHIGLAIFNGSTTAGRSSLSNAIGGVIVGATTSGLTMETILYVDSLDSGTNNYTIIVGLGDSFTSATQTNGIYFRYAGATNSGQWQCISMASSTPQTVSGGAGAAMTAGTWWKLRWKLNAAGTSLQCDYSIAGGAYTSLGSPITTGFPTGAIGPLIGKFNSGAGAGSRIMRVDYYGLYGTLAR